MSHLYAHLIRSFLSLFLSSPSLFVFFFFFYSSGHLRDLHSFPTRRSSDLLRDLGKHLVDQEARIRVVERVVFLAAMVRILQDRKSTRLNSSHVAISYAVFCLKKKKT